MSLLVFVQTSAIVCTIGFCLTPIMMCLDWRAKKTSDGFSSVNFVFGLLTMAMWGSYMYVLNEPAQIALNVFNFSLFSCYTIVYGYYHPKRIYLYQQLTAAIGVYAAIMVYASAQASTEDFHNTLGSACANMQIASMFGMIYEMYRIVFVLKTTEYSPAAMVFGGGLIGTLWLWLGFLIGDPYMIRANVFGFVLNIIQHGLYFIYPPLTWTVPIYGVGGAQKQERTKKD